VNFDLIDFFKFASVLETFYFVFLGFKDMLERPRPLLDFIDMRVEIGDMSQPYFGRLWLNCWLFVDK
jgi:hypothetical protein